MFCTASLPDLSPGKVMYKVLKTKMYVFPGMGISRIGHTYPTILELSVKEWMM